MTKIGVFLKFAHCWLNGANFKPAFSLLTSLICHYKCTTMCVILCRVNLVILTAVDVKDMNKNNVYSASSHTFIYFLFSVHSSWLSSLRARSLV